MSRFYNIVIGGSQLAIKGATSAIGPAGATPAVTAASSNASLTITNQVNGVADMGGVQVEIDISLVSLAGGFFAATPDSRLTIRGISIQLLSQASSFSQVPISISAGMQKGLPLATAAAGQSGIIFEGQILSAYGNWIGVEQSLEFTFQPSGFPIQGGPAQAQSTNNTPVTSSPSGSSKLSPFGSLKPSTSGPTPGAANISFLWPQGSNMASMIQTVLATALPGWTININISPNLVLTQAEPGYFATITQFARFCNKVSLDILGASNPTYTGVQFAPQASLKTLNITDNAAASIDSAVAKPLAAQDFIGQPTWLGPNMIQFNTVLRADIKVMDVVQLPQILSLQVVTTPASLAFARQGLIFSGNWQILYIRHIGNSRGVNAMDWVTTFQAVNSSYSSTQASPGNTSV